MHIHACTCTCTCIHYLYRVECDILNVFNELDVIDRGNENGRSREEEQKHKQHCRGKGNTIMWLPGQHVYIHVAVL